MSSKILLKYGAAIILACRLVTVILTLTGTAVPQWKYDVTLTGYPKARWKALTSYIDKPAIGDVTGDGIPEIIGAGIFGDVFCVDGRTGQILWTYEDDRSFELAIYICPALVDVDCDGVLDVVSVTPKGNVICLDGKTGRKLWNFKVDAPIVFSPTAFDLDRNGTPEIAVSDLKGNLYILSSMGKLLLRISNAVETYGTPAMGLIDNAPAVIATDRAGMLRCFNGSNGSLKWKFSPAYAPISTSPFLFKDPADAGTPWKVLFGTDKGEAFMVDARSGRQLWTRVLAKNVALGDFSLGDLNGDGALDFVCATADSEIVAARVVDGKELWRRKLNVPGKEYLPMGRNKVHRTVVAGEPLLVDADGDGKLDVIAEVRGLSNYIYALRGTDALVLWSYGNKDLLTHPALNASAILSAYQETNPLNTLSTTNPVYSQPTPVVADFHQTGKLDLIVNDRDEIGLISIPLPFPSPPGAWSKYAGSSCNNIASFSLPCVAKAAPPTLHLSVEPAEIWKGEDARLCWKSTTIKEVHIDNGVGPTSPDGCTTVSPAQATTWHALVKDCGGEARDSVSLLVKVREAPESWALEDVFFEYDWYRLTPAAMKTLEENIAKLKSHPGVRIELEATCDERGTRIYNQLLAAARAAAVRDFLVERGIDPARLSLRPRGESTKWNSGLDDAGWQANRRVHLVILPD